jgi:type IV secretion system protein VirB1
MTITNTLATLMATCAPLVHPTTLGGLIEVESNGNPYAVSINRPLDLTGRGIELPAFAPPHSKREALELTRSLLARGLGVSVGLAQINVEQLAEAHLRLADLFNPCANLAVAQRVLLDCEANQPTHIAHGAALRLRRTLSCYNTGDYDTGFRNHYVFNIRRAATRIVHRGSSSTRRPA